ncbi:MAG: tetratricopeptide repeat protein [Betaproteobacteria bacterium]|nr:tetratricopeptide repeat protein [Betaproteobacteria bacterium]
MNSPGRRLGSLMVRFLPAALIAGAAGLAVAQAPADQAPATASARALPEIDLSPQILFQVLAAEIAAQRGEVGSSAATYLSLARRTRDPRLAQRATELSLAARAPDRALIAARLWLEIEPSSRLASQTVDALQLSTGALSTAEPTLRTRLERARRDGTLPQTYESLQAALLRAPDKKQALALLERLAAPDQAVAAARLALAAIASAADAHERAAAEAAEAYRLSPDDENTAVMAARYGARAPGGMNNALTLLEQYLARQPRSLEARFTLARLLSQAGRADDARAQFEAALALDPTNPVILFSLAQVAAQAGQSSLARGYLQRYLDLPAEIARDNAIAMLFLGQIAEEEKRFEDAIGWYAKIDSGEQVDTARIRRALLLGRLKRIDEALSVLREGIPDDPRARARLITVEAQVLREAGRYADAFKVLDDALTRQPDDTDLLYDHAMAAEKVNRLDLLEASLRKLIEAKPDHAHAYNALGYTLADRNLRLGEAQRLIEKALELAPDDAHILDSMGWVLFRRGDLEGAIRYLRKAFALRADVEIGVHLGEVLWQAGMQDEARRLWREAREREPANEVLRETLVRLNITL